VLDWGFLNTDVPLTALDDSDYQSDWILPSHLFKDGIRFQSMYFSTEDSVPVVFDTGAIFLVSPHYADFISWRPSAASADAMILH
jgi:hypothetical protein